MVNITEIFENLASIDKIPKCENGLRHEDNIGRYQITGFSNILSKLRLRVPFLYSIFVFLYFLYQ